MSTPTSSPQSPARSASTNDTDTADTGVTHLILCPNPACGQAFESFETICVHVNTSVCALWARSEESDEPDGT